MPGHSPAGHKVQIMMPRFFTATRYLILIPCIGLSLCAAAFFVVGGIQLLEILFKGLAMSFGFIEPEIHGLVMVEILDKVHLFLVGTVLYITSIGFYQLFIKEIKMPRWLRVHNTEELETSLIGVVVVVLAVDFLGAVFMSDENYNFLNHGVGIALPIVALGLFVGLRSWAARFRRPISPSEEENNTESERKAP